MASMRAVELFGLAVTPGDEPVPAVADAEFPATFRITMAAIDPVESPSASKGINGASSFVGSTLRIIRLPTEDDSDDEDDLDGFDAQIASDEDGSEDGESNDEDANGGPSDPKKTPKALKAEKLRKELEKEAESMEVDDEDDDVEEEDDDDDGPDEAEEFVVCTLDPSKTYQQPLDITINEHEVIYFQATGTHKIYLTGNILIPDESDEESDEDDDYDMPPGADEIGFPGMDEDESDELDDMEDPRVVEVDSDDDDAEIPKLVKGKNKRTAQEDSDEEQDALSKVLKPANQTGVNGDAQQLSKSQLKKQRKKIKDNQGNAVEATVTTVNGPVKEDVGVAVDLKKEQDTKAGKKVQFAKDIIQGPSKSSPKPDSKKEEPAQPASEAKPQVNGVSSGKGGVKVVDGVTIDERKVGTGQAAKKGDKVSMRYIGKLEKDKRIFDSNKKGKPFQFRLGAGEVIPGWETGIAGMAVGGERRITVPPKLAYGNSPKPNIPANSTLVFDVKLLKID